MLIINVLGDTLVSLQRSAEALFHYDKALELETSSIIDTLAIKTKVQCATNIISFYRVFYM